MHLADTFIQSDLHLHYIQAIHYFCQYVLLLSLNSWIDLLHKNMHPK